MPWRSDLRSHRGKRRDYALHRPAAEGRIAGQFAPKRLRGQNACQHAHGRAGIATVESAGGSVQRSTAALNFDCVAFAADFTTQVAYTCQSAGAIGAGGKIREPAAAFGQRCQQSVAMGNGFIAGKTQRAHNAGSRLHDPENFRH